MHGRIASNSPQSSRSVRRRSSAIGSKVIKIARSARSERQTISSMPFRMVGASGLEEHLVTVGTKLANGETTASGDPAKGIGEPGGQARQIVECEDMAIVGRDHEIALFARRGSRWSCIGINQRAQHFREYGLCRPLLASDHQQWIGAAAL